jgi:hypothetical protein
LFYQVGRFGILVEHQTRTWNEYFETASSVLPTRTNMETVRLYQKQWGWGGGDFVTGEEMFQPTNTCGGSTEKPLLVYIDYMILIVNMKM